MGRNYLDSNRDSEIKMPHGSVHLPQLTILVGRFHQAEAYPQTFFSYYCSRPSPSTHEQLQLAEIEKICFWEDSNGDSSWVI